MKFTREWEDLTNKMGYWVDMSNPYITYDNRYIETLWYLLKQLYEKRFPVQRVHHTTLFPRCRNRIKHARVEPTGMLPRREGHDVRGSI